MDRAAFRNHVASLYNIDGDILDSALLAAGEQPMSEDQWTRFRTDPPRYFINTDKPTAEAIWRCVRERQPKQPDRVAELEDLLDRCAEFLDGYVDVDDGDYGQPEPNKAMILMSAIREVLPAEPAPAKITEGTAQ